MNKFELVLFTFMILEAFSYTVVRNKKNQLRQNKKYLQRIQIKARKLDIATGLKKLLEPDKEKEMQIEFDKKSLIRDEIRLKLDNFTYTQKMVLEELNVAIQGVDQGLKKYESKAQAGVGSVSASVLSIAKIASSKFE